MPQTGDDYSVTGSRGEDADGRAVCVPVDYDLTFDGTTLHFTKRGPLNPNATFLFRTTFSPEPTGTGGGTFGLAPDQAPVRQRPDQHGVRPRGVRGHAGVRRRRQLHGHRRRPDHARASTSCPAAPGVQYACVFDESAELVGSGTVQLTQGVFLIGDWTKFR